ncbi:heterokaryon incompatibility protein Het-C-domain-containing protein [Crassisporium funariophilum]|nr:heterokaryon incompatibility protein Het-C-domain-containing protein [Crassisporium funariophilum]
MAFSPSLTNAFLLLTVLVILLPAETYAFGAGDIPDFAYLNDKAFRHGDIENILETLVKNAGGAAIGGTSLLGFASSVIKHVAGGSKFSKSDIKKVYFGNWLRDYSQAMDIAGLSKLSADTLILVVSVLGFMTFGFSTEEFAVTADRLGVYLPVEHIDNPKGYAEKEGDARSFHPKLRPPVSQRELEFDQRTGMKNYMATENQGWDTSTAFVRRTFRACIEAGRRAQGKEGADLWEAYRLLGTGLHTMEDLLAHSNWCEIALRKMGHSEVFCHVGDRVTVNTPSGPAPPLVTGTFGSADFLHSLLGEAGDKLSQASVTDLSQKMNTASQGGENGNISALKNILGKIGGGGDDKLNKGEQIQQQAQGYHFNPDNVAPPEVQQQLLDVLKWHDDVMRDIIKKIEMVPGLENLLDEFSNALNAYIYTILAPYLGPILTQATSALDEGSKAVIDNDDQYEVFDNPNAHDPSHSLLSKDHFGLILNEPAGKIAQIVVEHSVNLIVKAWSDNSNPEDSINTILEAFHHPYYATGRSDIQRKMFDHMQRWVGGLGSESRQVIGSLTKESVREHKNKRQGLEDTVEPGSKSTQSSGYGRSDNTTSSYNTGHQSQVPSGRDNTPSYGGSQGYGTTDSSTGAYGQGRGSTPVEKYDDNRGHGTQKRTEHDVGYGGQKHSDNDSYGGQKRSDNDSYGSKNRDDDNDNRGKSGYGGRRDEPATTYGSGGAKRRDDDDDNRGSQRGGQGYGGAQRDEPTNTYGSAATYGGQTQGSYGSRQEPGGYAPSYVQPDKPSYGGAKSYGKDDDDDTRKAYGRKSGRDDSDDDKKQKSQYGGGRDTQQSYGASNTSGYGSGGGYAAGGGGYGKKKDSDDDDDDRKRHGRKKSDDDDDRRRSGGQGQSQGGYGQSGHGQQNQGYGGRDETFGVERMNIKGGRRDDDSDDDKKKREKYGGNRY